jgi:hypothetical protein
MPGMKMAMRVMIVWLMLLTVPFQGLAAAGALPCAPTMPGMTAMPAQAGSAAFAAGHDHAAMLAAEAARDAAPGASDGAHAEHASSSAHAAHDNASTSAHHCGGTSPCCVGAAITPCLPLAHAGPRLTNKLIPLHAAAPAAVDLATPERPPRHRLS